MTAARDRHHLPRRRRKHPANSEAARLATAGGRVGNDNPFVQWFVWLQLDHVLTLLGHDGAPPKVRVSCPDGVAQPPRRGMMQTLATRKAPGRHGARTRDGNL